MDTTFRNIFYKIKSSVSHEINSELYTQSPISSLKVSQRVHLF